MSAEDNVRTLKLIIDAINDRTFASVVGQYLAPGFVRHDLASLWVGVEGVSGVQDFIGSLIAAMPDFQLEIREAFATADRGTLVLHGTGKHSGEPLLGVEADGRPLEVSTINVYRFEDGKIAESWQMPDAAGILRQLGLID